MKNKVNKKILENVKLKISISNFEEEEKIDMSKMNKNVVKIASIACVAVISITGVVFAKDISNFVKRFFGGNASEGVDIAVNNGYVQQTKTEYQNSGGIEIAVDSFLMDDNNFAMNFKVRLSEEYDIKKMMMGMSLYDLKIVDENGKTVFVTHELQSEEMKKYKTEQEARENYDAYNGGYGAYAEIIGENELMYYLTATENPVPFPKSKKLFVTFSKIHVRKDFNEQPINEWHMGDWKFELDVPKEMYNREIITYKVKSCSDENTTVSDAILTNTSFNLSIPLSTTDKVDYDLLKTNTPKNISDKLAFQKEYIETANGKRFEVTMDGNAGYSVPEGKKQIEGYTQSFNLTRYDATDELTVRIFTNKGEEIKIILEKQ